MCEPYGAVARPVIHERDIAAVAARVLTSDGHGGSTYCLTGPQVLTQVEQVHAIGEAIGRALRFEEISPEAARQKMLTAGWLPSTADSQLNAYAVMATEPMLVTTTVEEIAGTPARTFREWAIDHADDFPPATDGSVSCAGPQPAPSRRWRRAKYRRCHMINPPMVTTVSAVDSPTITSTGSR